MKNSLRKPHTTGRASSPKMLCTALSLLALGLVACEDDVTPEDVSEASEAAQQGASNMFPATSKGSVGTGTSSIDTAKTPVPTQPVPIPYPIGSAVQRRTRAITTQDFQPVAPTSPTVEVQRAEVAPADGGSVSPKQ